MYRFWETVIKPLMEMTDARSVLEIGAQNGYTTKKIIEYMNIKKGKTESIDPYPNFDYRSWEQDNGCAFKMHLGLSLEILPALQPFDVYLVDGDHNWYTVYHELECIKDACKTKDTLIILHDIDWPYARRDLYYNPENIPEEYRNTYEKKGIKYGFIELQEDGINGDLCNAVAYGTPRNGVLTAIEDFVEENPEYEFVSISCCNGLGVIKKKNTHKMVFDYINNATTLKSLLKQTEENRLQLFQDRYKYKNKYSLALESIKTLKDQYEEDSSALRDQILKLTEMCTVLTNTNQQLQEKNDKAESRYIELQKESAETCSRLERDIHILHEEREKANLEYENLRGENEKIKAECSDLKKGFSETYSVLEKNNQTLRREGKKVRKQCRDLQKELQQLYASRTFSLAIALSKVYHSPKRVLSFFTKSKAKYCKQTTSGQLSSYDIVDKALTKTNAEGHLYPLVLEYERQNIYNQNAATNSISLVVCIHNALNDVIECLNSIWVKRTFPYEIILIDDGSDNDTKEYVEQYAKLTGCRLHRNNEALGYTKSANIGLQMSESDYVILLNSDTIVTDSWAEKMLRCFERYKNTGIVSPLSNAASYQSVPETKDSETGDWKINVLNENITIDMMGLIVEKVSKTRYPSVAALNGFCFMISRAVINTIGYLDEENFPKGYGEEVDYCIRASKAGFELRVVDDTYIFHEKSKSFTHKTRKELGSASKPVLKEKHGSAYLNVGKSMDTCDELDIIRKEVSGALDEYSQKYQKLIDKKIAFVLTAKGGSGGANSVCQEISGMRSLGIEVDVINSLNYKNDFNQNYPEISRYVKYYDKRSIKSFIEIAGNYDVLIATIFTTVKLVQDAKEKYPHIRIGYYVQDYEPFFFNKKEEYFQEAKQSYTRIPNMCLFAKTGWIADTVQKYHDVKVSLVEPSIDTRLYNPFVIKQKHKKEFNTICAMIRPKTARRNPKGTMEVLLQLKKRYGKNLHVLLFGCTDEEIQELGSYDMECRNLGLLKRWEVAELLLASDIFLDMSTYQAFGRTGLESMCLGCVPVLPVEGGVNKFACDNKNAIIVNTADINEVYRRICAVIDTPRKLLEMQQEGLSTAKAFNIQNAAWSEIKLLNTLFE